MPLNLEEIRTIASRAAETVLHDIPLTSAPHYIFRIEAEPLLPQGQKYVAYYPDGTPRYLGAASAEELIARIRQGEPQATFEIEAEAKQEEKPCPNLQPMAEWIKGEVPGTCRPCILTPVVQWYWQELKERGQEDIAAQLEAEVDVLEEDNTEQVMALCKDLDEIKAAASEELRKRLEEFDCSIQSFDSGETSEASEEIQTGD